MVLEFVLQSVTCLTKARICQCWLNRSLPRFFGMAPSLSLLTCTILLCKIWNQFDVLIGLVEYLAMEAMCKTRHKATSVLEVEVIRYPFRKFWGIASLLGFKASTLMIMINHIYLVVWKRLSQHIKFKVVSLIWYHFVQTRNCDILPKFQKMVPKLQNQEWVPWGYFTINIDCISRIL